MPVDAVEVLAVSAVVAVADVICVVEVSAVVAEEATAVSPVEGGTPVLAVAAVGVSVDVPVGEVGTVAESVGEGVGGGLPAPPPQPTTRERRDAMGSFDMRDSISLRPRWRRPPVRR